MVDRQDLDALLISALYGELTPADEARLQTHLETHPTDKTALADLTLARNAVRESRIFQVQLDPPQAVSALLLQEAARRAPRTAKPEQADREGWFQRFVRSFVGHPAMAAAAMLVLVVGIAGTAYMRGDRQFAEQTAERQSAPVATGAGPEHPTFQVHDESKRLEQNAGSAFTATLEDGRFGSNQWRQGAAEGAAAGDSKNEAPKASVDNVATGSAAPAPVTNVAKQPRTGDTYLSTERTDLQPKDLDADRRQPAKKTAPTSEADGESESLKLNGGRVGRGAPGSAPTGAPGPRAGDDLVGGVTTPADSPSPPPPPITGNNRQDNDKTRAIKGGESRSEPRPEPKVDPAAAQAAASSEERNQAEAPLLGWAKDTHARVVTQVRAGNCKDATTLALTLSSKVPGYYAQNVQNDRAVKSCIQYINFEREKAAERIQRARATNRNDEPPRAAPPASKR